MTCTIGQLGKAFGLSRSTLLYYDKLGLLCPDIRSDNNYRQYSQQHYERLQKIIAYRETGLSLEAITEILDGGEDNTLTLALEKQFEQLNTDINRLRRQQEVTLRLLGAGKGLDAGRKMDRHQWVMLLRETGMNENDMMLWHRNFERLMPHDHQAFLESLGIEEQEIAQIRSRSAATTVDPG